MLKKIIIFFSTIFFLTSCSQEYDKKLKISATTWIGYAPLFYAKEKKWLEQIDVKLLNVSSLSENMYLYKAGNSDAFVGTQYEYTQLNKENQSLRPIMMFDRSYGGDIILANRSLQEIQETTQTIDAYLEMDSINLTVLEDFIHSYGLDYKQINYINKDQSQIATLEANNTLHPTLIVTYVPYNFTLVDNGFRKLTSTRDNLDLLVVDAMFTKDQTYHIHEKQFLELKKMVDRAIVALQKDPKEFFETIQPYMLNMDYDEFIHSLDDIIWINKELTPELKERLQEANFPIRDLI